MKIITSKAEVRQLADECMAAYEETGMDAFIATVHELILKRKVKYPVLEYVAALFYKYFSETDHITLTDRVIALEENGSEVIAGKMLQLRLDKHYDECIEKAVAYIIHGGNWLCCDTVGERVLGHALLTQPSRTMPVLNQLSQHDNKWVIRSIGTAVHYAVKKGLNKQYVSEVFDLLLLFANAKEFHVKKGIGWAAKTVAKFHPEIIEARGARIAGNETGQWFKTKVKTGLGRTNKYAHRYTS